MGKNHSGDKLSEGMKELYQRSEFTDVSLVCAERSFPAHRLVLVAQSDIFKQKMTSNDTSTSSVGGGKQEIRLADINNPEAVKIMLDYVYQLDAAESDGHKLYTQEVYKDVLRLAQTFKLPGLEERTIRCLAKDISTNNCFELLTICDDFGCNSLREKILEQLAFNKKALAEVANSPQIMKYPRLMQTLLQHAAFVPDDSPQPKKKGRK